MMDCARRLKLLAGMAAAGGADAYAYAYAYAWVIMLFH
jgi:hypothetical protein